MAEPPMIIDQYCFDQLILKRPGLSECLIIFNVVLFTIIIIILVCQNKIIVNLDVT